MRPLLLALTALAVAGCPKKVATPELPVEAAFPERPLPGAPAVFTPAVPVETALSNRIPVYTVTDDSLPLVSVRLVVPTGSIQDPAQFHGLSALGTAMLGESSADRSALEQAAAVEGQAASISFGVGRESLQMSVDSHADRLDNVLPLAADALLRPAFSKDDWARVHSQHVTGVKASMDSNAAVARMISDRQWWGAAHPYGPPTSGTVSTAEAVTLAKVKAWHAAQVHATGAAFVVVGDVSSEQATEMLEAHFGAWKGGKRSAPEVGAAAAPAGLVIVDRPGSTQTVVSVVLPGQSESAADRAPLNVVQTIMGGSFTSRLNRRLREELGYTYGARMRVDRLAGGGTIRAGAAVRGDATADALSELLGLLQSAQTDGFSEAEQGRGRAQVITATVDGVETRAGLARVYANEIASGRAPAEFGGFVASLDTLTPQAVSSAAAMLDRDKALIVLVGDLSAIEGPLKDKGFTDWTVVTVGEDTK